MICAEMKIQDLDNYCYSTAYVEILVLYKVI
jgi:hypothetical protein